MNSPDLNPVAWRFKHCGEWVLVPWIPAVEHEPLYAVPARCDAQSEALQAALRAFIKAYGSQDSGTYGLDLAMAQAKSALSATKPALYNALRDIISIARDAQATDALGDIVKRAEEAIVP